MSRNRLAYEQDMPRGTNPPRHVGIAGHSEAMTAIHKPDTERPEATHRIFVRPSVGAAARIIQHNQLRYSNIVIARPVIILVEHGTKILRLGETELTIKAGGAVALSQNQVFDVVNEADENGAYRARWVAFDPQLVAAYVPTGGRAIEVGLTIGSPPRSFLDAYDLATEAIANPEGSADAIALHRMKELLIWLDLSGGYFSLPRPTGFEPRTRELLMAKPADDWTGEKLCRKLGVSPATLRRKLAAEGWSFQSLLTDVRMSVAMQLLQSTDLPILHIAQDVGYESQSRFALRFRARFGFAPSAIRGHKR